MRDSCEEGDDYAEGYAAGEKNQRPDLRRLELVERDAGATIAYDALLLRRYHMHKNQLVNYISRKKRGISSTTSRRYQ